jgi:hypothetical protein
MLLKVGQSVDHGFDWPTGLPGDCHRRVERFLGMLVAVTREWQGRPPPARSLPARSSRSAAKWPPGGECPICRRRTCVSCSGAGHICAEDRETGIRSSRENDMRKFIFAATVAAATILALPAPTLAHCDTLNGPVVQAARLALKGNDVTPVLKWVPPAAEAEVRAAFARTIEVRAGSPVARELADTWFFETVVRLHRASEGEPYTGLKPAAQDSALGAADHALEEASPDELVRLVAGHVTEGLRARHARAVEARRHADHSVEAGRAYVAAYVDYVHYVEALHNAGADGHGAASGAAAHAHAKK